jgi:hypothetical protein
MEHNRRCYDNDPDLLESFMSCPKYERHDLTNTQIEEITERAAVKAVQLAEDRMYKGVGKKVVGMLFYTVGVVSFGVFAYAVSKGWIKP